MKSTPDLCDDHENNEAANIRVLAPVFQNYGGLRQFSGKAVTIKCFEDNSVLKNLVEDQGEGRVIVMDGGGSLRRAILGDMIAAKAAQNGWAGMVINGCIRDCDEISEIELGVKALNTHPMKTVKRGLGDLNVDVEFAGQVIRPGQYIYCDNNGVIVSDIELS